MKNKKLIYPILFILISLIFILYLIFPKTSSSDGAFGGYQLKCNCLGKEMDSYQLGGIFMASLSNPHTYCIGITYNCKEFMLPIELK